MAGNTENIEAKLAAYIDGDLDAQGRAEIEKHLVANPQHRTLIEQLSKQRDLLRELPREEAPDDILEALHNQMERSVLLGDDDAGEPSEHMRIQRWPQVFAAAAIVLLTVGLGAIIYFVLPRGNGTSDYAVATQRGATLDETASTIDPLAPSLATADPRHDSEAASGPMPGKMAAKSMASDEALKREAGAASVAADANEVARKGDVFSAQGFGGGGAIAVEDVLAAQQLSQNADIARRLKDTAGGLKDNPVFVVVNSADPSAARSQVTQYLESNKIAWEPVSQPMPAPLDIGETQTVHLDRAQRSQVHVKLGEQRAAEGKSGPALQEVDKSNTTAADANPAANAPAAPAAANPSPAAVAGQEQVALQQRQLQEAAPAQQQQEAVQAPAGIADAAKELAKSAPSAGTMSNSFPPDAALAEVKEAEQKAKQSKDATGEQQSALQQQVAQRGQQQEALHMRQRGVQAANTESRLIVARGMTRQQAEELSSSLSKQQVGQRAALYETRAGADAQMKDFARANTLGVPATQPARFGGALAGQQLAASATPTTAPTGAAIGSERLEDSANRTPATSPSSEIPATQPADQSRAYYKVAAAPASQPSTQQAAQSPQALSLTTDGFDTYAATQPTTAAVAEERVDVVIVVNDDALVTPALNGGEQQQLDAVQQPASPASSAMPAPAATTAPTTQSAPATQPAL